MLIGSGDDLKVMVSGSFKINLINLSCPRHMLHVIDTDFFWGGIYFFFALFQNKI